MLLDSNIFKLIDDTTARLVLSQLLYKADNNGVVRYASRKIASDLGIARKTAIKKLELLKEKGVVVQKVGQIVVQIVVQNFATNNLSDNMLQNYGSPKCSPKCSPLKENEKESNKEKDKENHISVSNKFLTDEKEKENKNNIFLKEKETAVKRFQRPTLEQVAEYCKQRGNSVNPQAFIDYYESKGWVIGKNSPMKDWQAAVRTWERGELNNNGGTYNQTPHKIGIGEYITAEGKRTYGVGRVTVPDNAPPRPSKGHWWNAERKCWDDNPL